MRIKPHKSRILVNFPDVGLKESWSPDQLMNLFQHKPNTEILDVNYVYLDLIHNFLKVLRNLFVHSLFASKIEICPIKSTKK